MARFDRGEGEDAVNGRVLPVGAEPLAGRGVHFRVWAPAWERVDLVLEGGPGSSADPVPLQPEGDGYYSGHAPGAAAGTLYRFRLGGARLLPDPASRYQPDGPAGPSQVVDPGAFSWTDRGWRGVRLEGQILYEMHIGTFTPEGSWQAAGERLSELRDTGVSLVEVMPVAEWDGRFGWGYDGVFPYAPTRNYGTPDDFRRFVDRAHALGLGVILDVVYNHIGPSGCCLLEYSRDYLHRGHRTEWGDTLNYDGENCGPVREYFAANAAYWVGEFHLDGLRFDAVSDIYDSSKNHILAEMARRARAAAAERDIILVAENERQQAKLARPPEAGGYGLDALWNDDFHHSAVVAMTGRNEAYYTDYLGTPQELISAIKWGFLYQGQWYSWQRQRRGTPALDVKPAGFVNFLQNHDQVANSAYGERIQYNTTRGRLRAMTAVLLLGPGTPMLFQGQEFAASVPFLFFADHEKELARNVRKGRSEFLSQFRSLATPEMRHRFADPGDRGTFDACKLDHRERERNAAAVRLHRDLIRLRREDPVFRAQRADRLHGAVLGPEAFLLRWFGGPDGDRLLLVNLGRDLMLVPSPEPLLAPPADRRWRVVWSSEDPRYGGIGTAGPEHRPVTTPLEQARRYEEHTSDLWRLSGHAAVVLSSAPMGKGEDERTGSS